MTLMSPLVRPPLPLLLLEVLLLSLMEGRWTKIGEEQLQKKPLAFQPVLMWSFINSVYLSVKINAGIKEKM